MAYTENGLVEQPAIALFAGLGWETLNCWSEDFGEESTLGRENRGDVVLRNRLRIALRKLNPKYSDQVLDKAAEEMCRDRSVMSSVAANEQIYGLLKNGYKYVAEQESEVDLTVKFINWDEPEQNDFLLCSQMSITGDIETRRMDLLGLCEWTAVVVCRIEEQPSSADYGVSRQSQRLSHYYTSFISL